MVCDVDDAEEQSGPLPVEAGAPSSDRQVLAREARNDAIHASAPRCAVERE